MAWTLTNTDSLTAARPPQLEAIDETMTDTSTETAAEALLADCCRPSLPV
jgi:hypothetical protein